MTRLEANRKIFDIVRSYFDSNEVEEIRKLIEDVPNQRFGQIICNYICPDYRNREPSGFTKQIMGIIFPNNPDPFFEESTVTLKRLTSK